MRTVIKLGGSILEPEPAPALLRAVAKWAAQGEELVLVHGGGKALTALLARLGLPTEFRNGLRVTDAATLEAALMAFAGSVNKRLVAALNRAGARAVGLAGVDGGTLRARIEAPELGRVGVIIGGDAALLRALLDRGFLPVLAPLTADADGGLLNLNADHVAAACAALVGADRLVFVTDVAGVLDADGGCIPTIALDQLEAMVASGAITAGMLPKLAACREALAAGVGAVEIVGAAALPHLDPARSGASPGTRIVPARPEVSA